MNVFISHEQMCKLDFDPFKIDIWTY
jgi:hypothetical protein